MLNEEEEEGFIHKTEIKGEIAQAAEYNWSMPKCG